MSFTPIAPAIHFEPTKVAADTFVIHQVQPALGQPLSVFINSMVILGEQPVILDTGTPANRTQWLKDVFALVEPEDVRWIFLSHDDVDHTGNLDEALSACPNAKLVCNWAMVERHTNCFNFPIDRCRWTHDGDTIDIGDRVLHTIRPPVFDSPTTRGVYDSKTGVYWSVDTFATPLPDPNLGIADLDQGFWTDAQWLFAYGAVSPWLTMVDPAKYSLTVDKLANLDITTIAGCHTPLIEGPFIERALDTVRAFPTLDPPPLPDQAVLEQIVAAMAG